MQVDRSLFKRTKWYSPIKEKFLTIEQRWQVLYIVASLGISALMLTAFGILAWETLFRNTMVLSDDSFVWLIRYFANLVLDRIRDDFGEKSGVFLNYNKTHILRVLEDMGLIIVRALFHNIEVVRLLLRIHNREIEGCQ
ncbi:hypothetical protein UFO1_0634 [Pelosinus sp. UFO1]|nr:hypothetical protein UFO1_0634 [Pelosinus sp. UFO1]